MIAKTKAIFCDRDGTLIRDVGYVRHPNQVELLPGAASALAVLRRHGFLLVVISNQSGIERGLVTIEEADRVDGQFQDLLARYDSKPDATYYCPHLPHDKCRCRKPHPGMLLAAAKDLSLDLACSWMIGDKQTDITAGRRAGCRTAWIRPGNGSGGWPELVRRILNSHGSS